MEKMKETAKKIEMPKEMQQRILNNCYEKMEEDFMERKNSRTNFKNFRKPMVAAVALGLCLCLAGGTAALAGGKQGFFKDKIRWDGAIIGTTYEQATDEVQLEVSADANGVLVEVIFVDVDMLPYRNLEAIGLRQYQILTEDGTVVLEGTKTDVAEVMEGKANILLANEQLPSGTYTLVVTQLISEKKADQPLVISGAWECPFVFENLEQ